MIFYKTKNGKVPVREFLDSLNPRQAANVIEAMDLLKIFGLQLRGPYVKHVEDKIYELRIKDSDGIYRVFYFAASGKKFVMVHGFVKKKKKSQQRIGYSQKKNEGVLAWMIWKNI